MNKFFQQLWYDYKRGMFVSMFGILPGVIVIASLLFFFHLTELWVMTIGAIPILFLAAYMRTWYERRWPFKYKESNGKSKFNS